MSLPTCHLLYRERKSLKLNRSWSIYHEAFLLLVTVRLGVFASCCMKAVTDQALVTFAEDEELRRVLLKAEAEVLELLKGDVVSTVHDQIHYIRDLVLLEFSDYAAADVSRWLSRVRRSPSLRFDLGGSDVCGLLEMSPLDEILEDR